MYFLVGFSPLCVFKCVLQCVLNYHIVDVSFSWLDARIGIGIGSAYWYWYLVNLVLDTLLMYLLAGWTRVTAEMICQDRSFRSSIKRTICNCCELDNVNSHCSSDRNAASIFAQHPLREVELYDAEN